MIHLMIDTRDETLYPNADGLDLDQFLKDLATKVEEAGLGEKDVTVRVSAQNLSTRTVETLIRKAILGTAEDALSVE